MSGSKMRYMFIGGGLLGWGGGGGGLWNTLQRKQRSKFLKYRCEKVSFEAILRLTITCFLILYNC